MKFFTVFISLICCSLSAFAYAGVFHQFDVKHLTQENGLSNNTVLEIHQDERGFLWIGTDIGISRYDGVHFHNYNLIEKEPRAVERICELKGDEKLWLKIARRHQIACFDKERGVYIPLRSDNPELLETIQDICSMDSVLYALSSTSILQLSYRKERNGICLSADTLVEGESPLRSLRAGKDRLYVLDRSNNVLIYDVPTQKMKVLDYSRLGIHKDIQDIHTLNGHLCINTNREGVFFYQAATDGLRKLDTPSENKDEWMLNAIEMKDSTTFLATTTDALYRISFQGTDFIQDPFELKRINFDSFRYDQFVRGRISKLFVDQRNQIVWIGTFGKGLVKSDMGNQNIVRIPLRYDMENVTDMAQDANGYIWISTSYRGVWRSTTPHVQNGMDFAPWEKCVPDDYYCLHKDENGSLWIGGENGTLQWVNPLSNKVLSFHPMTEEGAPIGAIRKIYQCLHNKIWIATDKNLYVYDYQNDQCIASLSYEDFHEITALCEDGDGLMWLGTDQGVRSAVVENGQIQLKGGYESKAGISVDKVLTIYVNRYNELYVSYPDKIVQTDQTRQDVSTIKIVQRDMISGHVSCIIDDKSGNTWMGNNIGIMTIYNKTKASYTYTFPEQFRHVCQLSDGRLLWSNSMGLMSFDPRIVKKQEGAETLYISDVDVNYNKVEIGEEINGQVILEKPVYKLNELTLEHANNNVVFYLSNLSYNQMPNKIEYRLLPEQKEWKSDYRAQIEFSNLASGKHTLEVRLIPIYDKEMPITRLNIRVKTHWARTPWAYCCYAAACCLLFALVWYYFHTKAFRRMVYLQKKEQMKHRLTEEIEKRENSEWMQRLRNQARYRLVQELRNPLSLVTAPLKEVIADPSSPLNMKLAYRNAICMQDVCEQLLYLHEQESEHMQLHVAPYPVTQIADYAVASMHEVLNVVPVKLKYERNDIARNIWIDRQKIDHLLRNVLSNALRHITYNGNIHFKVSVESIGEKEYCLFQVEDDGMHMIEQSAVFLLSKEEGGEELSKQLYPEIGILLMKEHIATHQGEIRIEQKKESGTIVTVYIPFGKEHMENNPDVTFVEPDTYQKEELSVSIRSSEAVQAEEVTAPSSSSRNKFKILIVDDHKDVRLYLKTLFGSIYNVIQAENGEEAVRMVQREMPDLIILDIMMPVMDGFDCCRILKEDLKTNHIPIIVLTGLSGDENMVKAIELGANDYILKPFHPDVLRSKVKRLIQNRVNLKQTYMKLMMAKAEEAQKEEEKEDPFIRQIFEIVEKNLQNPDFSVKKLAEMVNMSQPTLYRRVKMLTNYTIIEVIRGVRMKRSAELLKTRKYSVQEVSEMVGYNDTPTFRKHFVDFYGTTPSNFANQEESNGKK